MPKVILFQPPLIAISAFVSALSEDTISCAWNSGDHGAKLLYSEVLGLWAIVSRRFWSPPEGIPSHGHLYLYRLGRWGSAAGTDG